MSCKSKKRANLGTKFEIDLRRLACRIAPWWRLIIWGCQERLLWKSKPRCLWLSTYWSCMLLKIRGRSSPRLLDIVETFVFWALKLTPQVSGHFPKVRRSSDRTRCKCFGNFDEKYKVLSSANEEIDDWMLSEMSLTYIRKRRGPRTEPWGTLQFVSRISEVLPLLCTTWDLFSK